MKKFSITLSILVIFEFCLHADIPQRKEMIDLANQYSTAIEEYFSMHLGGLEINSKNSLKDNYLCCSASDAELVYKLGAYTEVVRRLNEWKIKCARGLMHKLEPAISVEEFIEKAQQYSILHKQVSQSPEYQNHKLAHHEYKKMILNLLKQGFTVEKINGTLRSYGIANTRVLSRTEYWKKKEL